MDYQPDDDYFIDLADTMDAIESLFLDGRIPPTQVQTTELSSTTQIVLVSSKEVASLG